MSHQLSESHLGVFAARLTPNISLSSCPRRFVNFRNNPLTLNVTLAPEKTKTADDGMEDEDDREMFGREFMLTYIREARKRAHAVLSVH